MDRVKAKENKITRLLMQADMHLDKIFTRGNDTMEMTKARSLLTDAFEEAQKLTIIEEPESNKPMGENDTPSEK